MKRLQRFGFPALFLALCLTAWGAAGAEKATLREINGEDAYTAKLTRMLRLSGEGDAFHYKVQQGCATDGVYGYFILESQVNFDCSLWKVDLRDWTVADHKYGLPVDHGNDMTYNPKLNRLVVVHNKPRYNTISLIDPETLEITETKELDVAMFSIAYNEDRDQYVVGLSGGYNFSVLDSDFQETAFHIAKSTGRVTQGLDCDERYIYFPQWDKKTSENYLVVYDWDGNFINEVKVKSFQEIESLFHIGDEVYIAFNAGGSYIYKAEISAEPAKAP